LPRPTVSFTRGKEIYIYIYISFIGFLALPI